MATLESNRAKIFDLEGSVHYNNAKTDMLNGKVAENAALIAKNYNSAFMGNRQLANENTEALFRNRLTLLQCLPVNNEAEAKYRESKINEAKLVFLDFRSSVNAEVLSITQDMAMLNAQAIAINRRIMAMNESIRERNSSLIEENTKLIAEGSNSSVFKNYTPIVESNAAKIEEVYAREVSIGHCMGALESAIDANRAAADENSNQIATRSIAIKTNHDLIATNRYRIMELFASMKECYTLFRDLNCD